MKTINLFFDFEFTSLSPDAQPISLGIVSDENTSDFKKYPVAVVSFDKASAIGLAKLNGLNYLKKEDCILVYSPSHINSMCFSKAITHDVVIKRIKGYADNWILSLYKAALAAVVHKDQNIKPKSFYAEFSDFDINRCDDWVKENVVSKLKHNRTEHNWSNMKYVGDLEATGVTEHIKSQLRIWLDQFSDYQIQFISDCGTWDWYWLVQLLAEWEEKENEEGFTGHCPTCGQKGIPTFKTGLPKLPANISLVPFDLNDLIAIKKGITPKEAFDIERLGSYCQDNPELYNNVPQTHNSMFDAKVIKETYNKLK